MNHDYSTITEMPGLRATREQLSMLITRYDLAAKHAEGKDVLEVACGSGMGLGYMAQRARRVIGGEYNERNIAHASDTYQNRIGLAQLDAHTLPFADNSFDVILLYEALYYLKNPHTFLKEARRLLRENGIIIICTVNCEWKGFSPSPFSTVYYAARDLKGLLEDEGFTTELLCGFPASAPSGKEKIIGAIRRVAVALRLIPRSLRGREMLKRFFLGKLKEMESELREGVAPIEPLFPWKPEGTTPKVLYAVARIS